MRGRRVEAAGHALVGRAVRVADRADQIGTVAGGGVEIPVLALERAAEVWIPFVALAEIKAGFLGGSRAGENEGLLYALLRLPDAGVPFADGETTDVYARLFPQLRKAGTPIPANDLWIASLAVQHQLVPLSRDERFDKVPQVPTGVS